MSLLYEPRSFGFAAAVPGPAWSVLPTVVATLGGLGRPEPTDGWGPAPAVPGPGASPEVRELT
jgi:hypothetical protein